jgi:hypothetical protein
VYVTVVVPTLNVAGALLVSEATPQLSAVVGVPSTTAEAMQAPLSAFTVTFAAQVIEGGVLSTRVTVNVHVAVLPAASVAVSVTVVVPTPVTVVPAAGD